MREKYAIYPDVIDNNVSRDITDNNSRQIASEITFKMKVNHSSTVS